MKTNEKHEAIARIVRRSLVLFGLLVAALCFAGPSRAQSSAASAPSPGAKSADAAMSQAQAAPAAPQTPGSSATAEPAVPSEKDSASRAKGQHEGIAVHGHWTIEVKNPDGTVEKHVEFENSICPTQSNTHFTFTGGALALSLLATGNAVPGAWMIVLGARGDVNQATGVPPGCVLLRTPATPGYGITLIQSTFLGGSGSQFFAVCGYSCVPALNPPATPTSSDPTIKLSGQIPSAQSQGGEIDTVSAGNILCSSDPTGSSAPTPATCATYFPTAGSAILTGTQLTGTNGTPPPVTYIAGQAVSVAVVISFQ